MNAGLPHTIFAVLLVASVAAKMRGTDALAGSDNIEAGVIRVALSRGLTLSEEKAAKEPVRTLVFETPDCGRPILIALLHVTLEEEPFMQTDQQAYVTRYIYLDRTWDSPNRLASFFEWKKNKLLALLGLTQYAPSDWMLRLASPLGCVFVDTIDWRGVWSYDYVTTVSNTEFTH
jgi:hypothetical protein